MNQDWTVIQLLQYASFVAAIIQNSLLFHPFASPSFGHFDWKKDCVTEISFPEAKSLLGVV